MEPSNGNSESPVPGQTAVLPADGPSIPNWVNEEHFVGVLKEHVTGFVRIVTFEPKLIGGAGENYASIMLNVKATVEVVGAESCICCHVNPTKEVSFILKTLPQGEMSAALIALLGLFPRELRVYEGCLPEFTQIFRKVGQEFSFAPKMFKLAKDPGSDYVLLDDLKQGGFKNINRLEGCDKEHTEAVLKLLAKFHAASAVRYELKGQYENILVEGLFNEKNRDMINAMKLAAQGPFLTCLREYKISSRLFEKVTDLMARMTDIYIELDTPDLNAFNVLSHGDLWANNIMFRHNDEGKVEEVLFIDFQVSRYTSPAVDLFYFLLSSTQFELKVSHFDYFIQYYHDHLVENLRLLGYPKKIPTMKDLRVQLLKYGVWGISTAMGVMSAALLDPTKEASMDNFMDEGEKAIKYKMKIYENPRYVKHFEAVVPWLDTMGFLD